MMKVLKPLLDSKFTPETYSVLLGLRKAIIESTKTTVISASALISILKIVNVEITIEQATVISLIIGALNGGIKFILNWHKNKNK